MLKCLICSACCSSSAKKSIHPLEKQGYRKFSQLDKGGSGHRWSVQHSQGLKNGFCDVLPAVRHKYTETEMDSTTATVHTEGQMHYEIQVPSFLAATAMFNFMSRCHFVSFLNDSVPSCLSVSPFETWPPSMFVVKHGHVGLN